MIRLVGFVLAPLVAAAHPLPATAQASAPTPSPALASLQQRDTMLFSVGWRLVTGNARYCEDASPAPGLLLHDAHAYGDAGSIRSQLGLMGDIGVQAVAPGSPASRAGLAANMTLLELDGMPVAEHFPRSEPSWQRLVELHAAVVTAFADGEAQLRFARSGGELEEVTLAGEPACPTRFEVLDDGARALADGKRVIFGRDFPGFKFPEDQFAAAVAHELAHNLLKHRALLDREGRSRKLRRLTERDADRLMPWLLHNAGYDPRAAARFMDNWGRNHSRGFFTRALYNEGWDERLEHIEAEIAYLDTIRHNTGEADWQRDFRREAEGQERPVTRRLP